jgi:hypothetical protein
VTINSFAMFLVYGDPGAKSVIEKSGTESNYVAVIYSLLVFVDTLLSLAFTGDLAVAPIFFSVLFFSASSILNSPGCLPDSAKY